jgi:diguanylate cyclase (GGDEF)-like protein
MPSYLVINATLATAVMHPSSWAKATPSATTGAAFGMRGWRMVLLGIALCGVGLNALVVPDNGWQRLPAAASIMVMVTVILARLYRAVTDLESAERTMRHQANHDQLTGLVNRARLMETMRDAVDRSPTLFFVDLDGFKAVNDTQGHACGDAVLKVVAERLTGIVRSTDTVARLGGDEFVVVCPDLRPEAVTALASRIEEVVREPVGAACGTVTVGASIGVLTLPTDAITGQRSAEVLIADLLRAADAAMYEAKRGGGGTRIVDYAFTA